MEQLNKMMVGLALFALSAWAGAEVSPVRSMAAACANCHGTDGVALEGMQSLAGRPRDDLLKKMLDYKTGKMPASIMQQLAKGYSDEQIEQLAGYFAALKK